MHRRRVKEAVALLDANGGPYFGFLHGYEALNAVIDASPEQALYEHQTLLSCYCFSLVKAGRARRAFAILRDRQAWFESPFVRELIELTVFIHTGEPVTKAQLRRWRQMEGLLPVGNPLQDGLYYNCMAIILVRINLLKQARNVALRGIESYRKAENPSLEFYMYLHLAHMSLLEGNLHKADREMRMARALVQENEVAHATSAAFLEIIESAIALEMGRYVPDRNRLEELRRSLVNGDSWAEIFNELCRVGAFSLYFSEGLSEALDFLADCQIDFNRRHGDFSEALEIMAATVELLDGRTEHAQRLSSRPPRDQSLVGATGSIVLGSMLGKLGQNDLAQSIAREMATSPRFVLADELIRATQAKEERDKVRQRRHVQNAMRLAVNEGLVGPFLEHREAVVGVSGYLATGKFARGHIQLGRLAKRVHKLVRGSFLTPDTAMENGVTAHQMRVLSALRDGASNKQIARKLGLSEAAVKYHVGRLLSQFQVKRRGQLIERIEELAII
ncbi:MAG: LuxR C-terminal-related transcriptional regulator [Pseudomonadota bacterium]